MQNRREIREWGLPIFVGLVCYIITRGIMQNMHSDSPVLSEIPRIAGVIACYIANRYLSQHAEDEENSDDEEERGVPSP